MSQNTIKRTSGKRWRDRAEEMLTLAQAVQEDTRAHMERLAQTRAQLAETRAQMERLAADWLLIAAREDERRRPACDDFRSADSRHGNDGGV
jgi:hypothetical protein